MPPRLQHDWSDSDDELLVDVETSVLLGVPDGLIDAIADINDAAVSRIGGHPVRSISRMYHYSRFLDFCRSIKAFLPSREPPFSSSHCKICSNPCQLLVQMWCPFEDTPMDRALYIWGCSMAICQGKDGR
jgi:pre-rRNA-processing protein TSR4